MILLMLDFDGTLAPIRRNPEDVVLGHKTKRILNLVRENRQARLAIISGRSLADIIKRVGLKGIYYAGCHGLEIEGPDLHYLHPAAEAARPSLEKVARDLRQRMTSIPGIDIEDKGWTLAVHFRKVGHKAIGLANKTVARLVKDFRKDLRIMPGRKVLEIMPRAYGGKGMAVAELLRLFKRERPFPIYVGDDLTDEDAFQAIKGRGLCILVDNRERSGGTLSNYRMGSIDEVRGFLKAFTP